jgi:rhamnosyltransferase subunit B
MDALRDELALPRVRQIGKDWIHSPSVVLCFWPDWFAPAQLDWPKQANLLGFIARETGERDASEELRKFLESGAPPIVFTFGSAVKQAARLYDAAVEACKSLGIRSVLVTRFREQVPADLPANLIHATYAPFSWLLPRAAAVVHHAGIGTVGQSLAAGIPQVCVPGLVFDTIDNARRLKKLGVARVLTLQRCDAASLTSTIRKLLDDKTVAERCKQFARLVHDVDAIQCACDELELLARNSLGR